VKNQPTEKKKETYLDDEFKEQNQKMALSSREKKGKKKGSLSSPPSKDRHFSLKKRQLPPNLQSRKKQGAEVHSFSLRERKGKKGENSSLPHPTEE